VDLRFVYDGWNLVQEIDGLVEVGIGRTDVAREYTWGLDLSGESGNPSPAQDCGLGNSAASHTRTNSASESMPVFSMMWARWVCTVL